MVIHQSTEIENMNMIKRVRKKVIKIRKNAEVGVEVEVIATKNIKNVVITNMIGIAVREIIKRTIRERDQETLPYPLQIQKEKVKNQLLDQRMLKEKD